MKLLLAILFFLASIQLMSQPKAAFVEVKIYFGDGENTNQVVETRPGSADLIRLRIRERDEHFSNGSLCSDHDKHNSLTGEAYLAPGRYTFTLSISGGNAYRTALEERELAALRHKTQLSNAKRIEKANSKFFSIEENSDLKDRDMKMLNIKMGSKLEDSGSEESLFIASDRGPFGSLTSGATGSFSSLGTSDRDSIATDAAVAGTDLVPQTLYNTNQYDDKSVSTRGSDRVESSSEDSDDRGEEERESDEEIGGGPETDHKRSV